MRKIIVVCWGICVAGLVVPQVVLSAEEGAASKLLEEVVVTARKREETVQSVPIPITALSGDQLEVRNITDIRDIEKLSPNTDIQSSSVNGTATQVFMRGIGQVNWSSTQDPKIGIYVDGVYLSRPQGGLVDLMDVERVEILRGPQGTLFGRNTTAGLIHIINKKPSLENEFEVEAGAGSDGQNSYGFVANRAFTDTFAGRFALYSNEADGDMKNSITGKDRGNIDSLSYRGSLLWELDNYSAHFTYDHFESDERAPLGSCRFTGPRDPFQAGGLGFIAAVFGIYDEMIARCEETSRNVSIDTTNDESTESDVDAYSLKQTYDFGWAEITSLTAYREIENFNGSWGWVMGNGPGSNFLEILDNPSENEIFSQELRLAGSTGKLEWVIGAYVFEEDSEESVGVPLFRDVVPPTPEEWPFFYAPSGGTNPDGSAQTLGDIALATQLFGSRIQSYEVTNKNRAFFAEGTYAISDKLDLTVGARYTKDEREFLRFQTLSGGAFDPGYMCPGMPTTEVAPGVFLPASDHCFQDVDYSKTTPRAILAYQLTDEVMLYGSFSVGYSSGGFNQDARMRPFLPEVSDNFEIGAKTRLFDGKVRLNATAFYNTYENQQLTVGRIVDGQPTADLINAQEATLEGVEVDLLAQLTDSLSLTLSAGYLQGEYDKFTVEDNTTDPVTLEESIVLRDLSDTEFGNDGSELSIDISLLHMIELPFGGELTSSLGFSFKDDQYYTLMNTPSSKEDSYWIMDGRITWYLSNGNTSVSLWGTNLTDEDYIDNMVNQSGDTEIGGIDPSLGMTADYWGQSRRIGLEVKHSFQ